MTEQPEHFDLNSHHIAEEKQEELLRLFPEVRTEGGKIDFERLKLALGEMVDVGKERYGMNWPGKAECFRTIQQPSMATLRPAPEESVNFDTTENLIIEGDNLEVLKLLQKSYLGKIKMIYIDPPYNTGNDFIYPDNYTESLQTYLEYTGQVDTEGKRFGNNTDSEGRFHSKWVNMMYPRLFLAKNLLRTDGIIFISIDDNEAVNLRRICDEIFGEENCFAQIPWQSRTSVQNDTDLSIQHEYIVAYARVRRQEHRRLKESNNNLWHDLPSFAAHPLPADKTRYDNPDNDPRGPWKADPFDAPNIRENLTYSIVNPNTGQEHWPPPGRCWRTEQQRFNELLQDRRIIFGKSGDARPQLKVFYEEKKEFGEVPTSWFDGASYGTVTSATQELQDLFGGNSPFPFPKPSSLIRALLTISTKHDDIVMDFFAGAGSTAHAVLDVNHRDGVNRKFVMIQLPEPTAREDYPTIADICKERVRRVIKKLNAQDAGKLDLNGGKKQDCGFRVFKLADSNFKTWNAHGSQDSASLEKQLELHIDHIKDGRDIDDLLYELLLKSGFPLTTPVEKLTLAGKDIISVAEGLMFICLEKEISLELIKAMADKKPERVVCLDAGFVGNDQLKANAVQIFKTKEIKKFETV
ncbi:MAG: site-specific DNA-methyltransferase [Dehalogenimonas sp.]|uniref:Site-specific DNA-methyltransferase n=1 Tax=Candidatus Dehalogenimonas loeffleri TaxID=3127115 RepID=A0ABZ2JAD6_9CHLR|nr:site-specific DNA-methyltransferase [Dehalogenimonas sp.]